MGRNAPFRRGGFPERERFEDAMRTDPFDVSPDLLYPIIGTATVKCTGCLLERRYETT